MSKTCVKVVIYSGNESCPIKEGWRTKEIRSCAAPHFPGTGETLGSVPSTTGRHVPMTLELRGGGRLSLDIKFETTLDYIRLFFPRQQQNKQKVLTYFREARQISWKQNPAPEICYILTDAPNTHPTALNTQAPCEPFSLSYSECHVASTLPLIMQVANRLLWPVYLKLSRKHLRHAHPISGHAF